MDVRDDGGDGSSLISGWLGAPCGGIEMIEEDLIHPLVHDVGLHQYLAEVGADFSLRVGLRSGHDFSWGQSYQMRLIATTYDLGHTL